MVESMHYKIGKIGFRSNGLGLTRLLKGSKGNNLPGTAQKTEDSSLLSRGRAAALLRRNLLHRFENASDSQRRWLL